MASFESLKLIPVVGRLPFARGRSHWEACKETFLAVVFSSLPIWFPFGVAVIFPSLPAVAFLKKLTGEGELFLYASAFVGPLIYSIFRERQTGNEIKIVSVETTYVFPYGLSFVLVAFLICGLSVIAFGFIRLIPLYGYELHGSFESILWSSFFLYSVSVLCLYSSAVYRNELDEIPSMMREEEDDFLGRWQRR